MPRGKKSIADAALLAAALEGLEAQKQRLEEQIGQVRALLGKRARPAAVSTGGAVASKKKPLSAAARRRISVAQKKRWAEYRKKSGAAKQS